MENIKMKFVLFVSGGRG